MTTNDDAITKDQDALDAEQVNQAPPAYATVEDFNALKDSLTSQFRGLQGTVDRTAAQFDRERADTDRQRRVNALEGQLENAEPATRALLEDRIQEIRSTPAPQQVQQESVTAPQGVDTQAGHRAFLESIDIDPALPGIDWSQNLLDIEGQRAFVKSAVAAKVAATQEVARKLVNIPAPTTVNPPVESPSSTGNGGYRTVDDLYDAYLMREISQERYQEELSRF